MNRNRSLILSSLASVAVIVVLLVSIGFEATAQESATPTPRATRESANRNDPAVFYADPATSTGDAEWAVSDDTFESFYPHGFKFTIKATSSAGEIESATAVWSHAPRNLRRASAEYNPDSGIFTATWPGVAESSIPPWVAVNYQWRFTDVAGNTYTTAWVLGNEYDDNNQHWDRYESEDIIVFVEAGLPADTGQQTLDAMAAQRETYRQAWGALLSNKPRAILFATASSFTQWRYGETNQQVIGLTSSDWGGTVQRLAGAGIIDLTWGTVLHEVGHLYQQEFAPAGFPSGTWWNEGNATFFELNQQYDYEQRVRNLAVRNQLPTLLLGSGPGQSSTGPDGINRLGYDTGYTFFKWIAVNYGLSAHYQIVQGVRDGSDRNATLERVLGLPIGEIESRWRVWLGAPPEVPTLIPTEPFRFPPTVTPFIFPTRSN
jgi:hypothetical protein